MTNKKSIAKAKIVIKKYEDDGSFGIGSVIRRTFVNGSSIDNMDFTMLDDKTKKYVKIGVLPVQDGYISIVQLKEPMPFKFKSSAYSDVRIAWIKFKPKDGLTKESFFDQSSDD